jgi:hypothetical protein
MKHSFQQLSRFGAWLAAVSPRKDFDAKKAYNLRLGDARKNKGAGT